MPRFTEEQVKKYMVAKLPDGKQVIARRVEWEQKTSAIVASILVLGNCEWKSISGIYDYVATSVEEFFTKYPQFEVLEWKRLFDDERYG